MQQNNQVFILSLFIPFNDNLNHEFIQDNKNITIFNTAKQKNLNYIGLLSNNQNKCEIQEVNCIPLFIKDSLFDEYFKKCCKQLLWKPFHHELIPFQKGLSYEELAWKSYVLVNQKFADTVCDKYKQGDLSIQFNLVLIHDYHLMLVPNMIRIRIQTAIIGFFLHVPFPTCEIFKCIFSRKEILKGLLEASISYNKRLGWVSNMYFYAELCFIVFSVTFFGNKSYGYTVE